MLRALSHTVNPSKHFLKFPLFGVLFTIRLERLVWILVFSNLFMRIIYTSTRLKSLSNFNEKFRRQILLNFNGFFVWIFDWFPFVILFFVFFVVKRHFEVRLGIVGSKEIHKLTFYRFTRERVKIFAFKLYILHVKTCWLVCDAFLSFESILSLLFCRLYGINNCGCVMR
jgi:hypothetical protein